MRIFLEFKFEMINGGLNFLSRRGRVFFERLENWLKAFIFIQLVDKVKIESLSEIFLNSG